MKLQKTKDQEYFLNHLRFTYQVYGKSVYIKPTITKYLS